jgi:GTP cyclohydrolase I
MSEAKKVTDLDRSAVPDCAAIENIVRSILQAIGEDPGRDGLQRTPQRVGSMFEEIFAGIGKDPVDEFDVVFDAEHDREVRP